MRILLVVAALAASVTLGLTPAHADDGVGVHRFWSPRFDNAHFFTMSSTEAQRIIDNDPNWTYEGVAFKAWPASGESCSAGSPVFRFWSSRFQSHFYTSSRAERDRVRSSDPNWAYEGAAYCAFLTQKSGSVPLYRFWSPGFGKHFYTASKAEAGRLRTADPNWDYEGIAYYVLPDQESSPTLQRTILPSTVLNLTNWKLTLPIGTEGSPTEIKQPNLNTYHHPDWFFTHASGDGVVFRADTTGVTTVNSDFPRSELREMNGSSGAAWTNTDGKAHTMTIVQAITHLPDRVGDIDPVVAGQIHDGSDDVIVLRAQKVQATQKIRLRARGDGIDVELDPSYTLGTRFKIEFKAASGKVTMTYWKSATSTTPTSSAVVSRSGSGWYFKAGCYTQATTRPSSGYEERYGTGYGEVVIHDLVVKHA